MSVFRHHSASAFPWIVIGAGYTGERLARQLAIEGAEVWVTRRRGEDAERVAERAGPGVGAAALDIRDSEAAYRFAEGIPRGAVVVDSVPPAEDGGEGERRLVRAVAGASARRFVYLSSTGVYPPGGGAWIDEASPVGPQAEHGRRRLAAEEAALGEAARCALEAVSLRIAAIYGPGRGTHARMRAGTYRLVGAGDAYVSRVHVDDLASAIARAGTAEALPRRVYTVADDAPMTARAFAEEVAKILDVPPPPRGDPDEVSAAGRAMLAADRKISNRRLRTELGVSLRYPSGPDGVRAALAEEGAAPE